MRFPKPKRLADRKAIKAARKLHCELCGRSDMGLQVHHIISKGAAGPDHRCNLLTLCASCHTHVHAGRIDKDMLWNIVAQRENMSVAEAEDVTRRLVRQAHVGEVI